MKKTKIVCTLGPASRDEKVLEKMLLNGMNVARLNFSHGSHEYHKETIELFRKVRDKLQIPAAVMLDTKGPEIRLGDFENEEVTLSKGDLFTLTTKNILGNQEIVSITYKDLPSQLQMGNKILIDDGKVSLEVVSSTITELNCKVLVGGKISNHKGVNVPNVHLNFEYLSQKDGIMVARGDMGVEVEYERLPGLQKKFIRKCYQAGKVVITATQMLESMIHSLTPTRAEITDVANAVFDGTSAIMLSGETAMGDHPDKVVKTMAKIARQAENDALNLRVYDGIPHDNDIDDTTNAICDAACTTARDLNAKVIIAVTQSGHTARCVSKYRPDVPIVAPTPNSKTYHQLSLSWGVYPVKALFQTNTNQLFDHAIACAKMSGYVNKNDRVVITAGENGITNILNVQIVKSR